MTFKGDLHQMWPVPVLCRVIDAAPGYNDALRDLILSRRAELGGTMIGVVDGEKTRSDLLRCDDPVIEPLRGWILDLAEAMNSRCGAGYNSHGHPVAMVAEAWGVVYDEWGYHNMHSHHDSAWSGVYYVYTGNMAVNSGTIEFLDPRPAACALTTDRSPLHPISPAPGLMLGFPSWLQHWVTPYQGDSVRICVAFNIGFQR